MKKMHEVVVITGIPGVGKTTVVTDALKMISTKYEILNFGDVMFSYATSEKLANTRDEMRKLDPATQKTIQIKAAEEIQKRAHKTSILIDTHATIKTKKGYLAGLPIWVLEKLQPTKIILIEADSSEIYTRRVSDKSRVRDDDSEEEIKEHQELNRSIAMAYAVISGATVSIIRNNNGEIAISSKKLSEVL